MGQPLAGRILTEELDCDPARGLLRSIFTRCAWLSWKENSYLLQRTANSANVTVEAKETPTTQRRKLRLRLRAQIARLRKCLIDELPIERFPDLALIAGDTVSGSAPTGRKIEALVREAIHRAYADEPKKAGFALLSLGLDGRTRTLMFREEGKQDEEFGPLKVDVEGRHKQAWQAFGQKAYKTFTSHETGAMHKDLAREILKISDDGNQSGEPVLVLPAGTEMTTKQANNDTVVLNSQDNEQLNLRNGAQFIVEVTVEDGSGPVDTWAYRFPITTDGARLRIDARLNDGSPDVDQSIKP